MGTDRHVIVSPLIFRKAVIIDEFFHHMSPLGVSDTYVHLRSPTFTSVHLRSPMFTSVHLRSPPFTYVHLRSPPFTYVHLRSPTFTTQNCSCTIDILCATCTNLLTSMPCNVIQKNAARFIFPYFNAQGLPGQTPSDRPAICTTMPI
jgi:hypothetical protein